MKVLVIGANGRVGSKLINGLLQDGHQVIGTSRNKKKLRNTDNYQQIKLDLSSSLNNIIKTIPEDTDAIYFVSGSIGKNLLQIDLHGAVKTIQAAEQKGIKRYILLSALYSLEPDKWTTLINYYTAKYFADLYLINQTGLDYTIIQPGYLTQTNGTNQITTDKDKLSIKGKISIQNVATTLKEVLDKPNTFKKAIPILDGDTAIREAIANFN